MYALCASGDGAYLRPNLTGPSQQSIQTLFMRSNSIPRSIYAGLVSLFQIAWEKRKEQLSSAARSIYMILSRPTPNIDGLGV